MPRRGSPYGPAYQRARRHLVGLACELRLVCDGTRSTSGDHVPPLSQHRHIPGTGCCRLRPACLPCQWEQGHRIGRARPGRRRQIVRVPGPPEPSRQW